MRIDSGRYSERHSERHKSTGTRRKQKMDSQNYKNHSQHEGNHPPGKHSPKNKKPEIRIQRPPKQYNSVPFYGTGRS